jgi:propionyl-CoA carboxylase alpha chain
VTTGYLEDHPEVASAVCPNGSARTAALVAAVLADRDGARSSDHHWGFAPAGWRTLSVQGHRAVWRDVDTGQLHPVEVRSDRAGAVDVLVGPWPSHDDAGALQPDERIPIRASSRFDGTALSIELDGRRRTLRVSCTAAGLTVAGPEGTSTWVAEPRFVDHDAVTTGAGPIAPLPGTVLAVHVAAGDAVDEGQALVVIEAMKMEHVIRAPSAATVTEVRVAAGDRVDAGELLVLLDDAG